ncbi:MAG: tRNA (guanosine(46)-N7)-methyltransferase TrmB [Trueperaceae bacterium]
MTATLDPELDVRVHDPELGARRLIAWRRAPFPAPWSDWFKREAPLHLEIGFGDGRFTVARAAAEPEHDFVGIEASGVSVRRAQRKLRAHDPSNLRVVKAGAQAAVRQLFAPASLHSVTVNFPDPWPKERHERNRLLRTPFLATLAERLRFGGEIRLATDHEAYFDFSNAQARDSGLYRVEEREPPPEVHRTKYALKWLEQGKPVHYAAYVRTDRPAPSRPPIERPSRMPHALLHGRLSDAVPFEKTVLPYEDGHVVLHEAMRALERDRGRDRWLIRVTVDEPDLIQQVLVAVQRREDSEHIVRLESFGDPIVTPAVRGAIHAVTEWLTAHGDWTVAARNY